MPNWCTTNYIAKGDTEDLRKFVETLNTMPNLENGFGKNWMGNFFSAFGMSRDEIINSCISCRGVIDPSFYAVACFFGPQVEETEKFIVEKDGTVRFSTTTAWGRSTDFEELVEEHFPSITLAWSSTDEFGNFHCTYNPENLPELAVIAFNGNSYGRCEVEDLKNDLKDACPDFEFDEKADMEYFLSDEFRQKYNTWVDSHTEEEQEELPTIALYDEIID